MTHQFIEIKKLDRSPHNVRKTETRAAMAELKASILAHGLMQNLVVVAAKKGKFHVIAGGRRLEALRELQAEGKLPADYAVPCQIAEGEQAVELSLAENTVRQAMHPADEFEAFAELIERGQTAAQVAARFGVTERHVLQRMKLGRVAPELLVAYRAGEVTLDALTAFAVTDDRKRQVSVWKSLDAWQENNARVIRQKLTEQMVESDSGLAKFVGLEAYKAAGGKVKADLFSEDSYLEDAELLERLASGKLEAEAEKLRAEGWGWVEVENDDSVSPYSCRRIHPKPVNAPADLVALREQAQAEYDAIDSELDANDDDDAWDTINERLDAAQERLDEIEEQLAAYAAYDPEEMKLAGCLVSYDRHGELDIEKGLVKPQERKADGDCPLPHAPAKKEKPEFSQSLIADLKAYRCQVAQVAIASSPEAAFDLLVFHAACEALSLGSYLHDGLDVHFRKTFPKPSVEAKNAAAQKLEAIRETLPLAWLEVEGEDERFNAFRELPHTDKLRILAYCTALTVKPDLAGDDEFPTAYETTLSLTGFSVAEYWRPTKDNYLSRVTRDQLLGIGKEVLDDRWAHQRKDAKKTALAESLHDAFAKPDTTEAVRNWLPKGMAFLDAPAEAKSVEAAEKPTRKPRQKVARSNAA